MISSNLVLMDTNLYYNFADEGEECVRFFERMEEEGLSLCDSSVGLCEMMSRFFDAERPSAGLLGFSRRHAASCLPSPEACVSRHLGARFGAETSVGEPDWHRLRDELLDDGTATGRKEEIVRTAQETLRAQRVYAQALDERLAGGVIPPSIAGNAARKGYAEMLAAYGSCLRRQYARGYRREPNDRADFLFMAFLPEVRYFVTNDNRAATRGKAAVRGGIFDGTVLRKKEFIHRRSGGVR